MHETTRLAGLIQERIADTIDRHRRALQPLGPDASPLLDEALTFLAGGKRFRAQFAALGYRAVRPLNLDERVGTELGAVLDAACGLELFHAAALIHDDVIDRSDTRRGRPSVHRLFEAGHRERHWRGASDHFGLAGAILLGDLLQSWADELLQAACDALPDRSAAARAREHFNRMRSEVAVGQYLDVLEEQIPGFAEHAEQLERSTRVLVYKSAKYSVEAPLLIGAALAGADEAQEDALASFGLPVGVAFQLRDDLLGVFGDAELTGKPIGDDLAEGKRTVLVTLTRERLPATQRRIFDDLLGTDLDREQVAILQRTIRESGAVERVEEMIARNVDRATGALQGAPVRAEAAAALSGLAERAARRSF
ncbi:polyprenyl synthetase family protein [Leucobacter massiliensis]|uniref:Geranylgeranyl pyrophosphate synthase n=1 Tax=Leucobacter massiliensis TaxID=1686285 RepID=A0A2S9QQD0_9MICO|nr:polyprenyl synthetase family protein [Leucobacter massiliensis]PRI11800.1 geranylgeranyl pyrophosphate synthase [Leucobacter massiliensis]